MNFIKVNWRKAGCASVMEALFEHNKDYYPEQFYVHTPKRLGHLLTEYIYSKEPELFELKQTPSKFALALYSFALLYSEEEESFTRWFYRDMFRVLRDEPSIEYCLADQEVLRISREICN